MNLESAVVPLLRQNISSIRRTTDGFVVQICANADADGQDILLHLQIDEGRGEGRVAGSEESNKWEGKETPNAMQLGGGGSSEGDAEEGSMFSVTRGKAEDKAVQEGNGNSPEGRPIQFTIRIRPSSGNTELE